MTGVHTLPCIDVLVVGEKSMKEDRASDHWSSDPARYYMMTVERDASDSHRLTHGHRGRNRDGYCSRPYLHLYKAVPRPRANRRRKGYELGGGLRGEESNDVGSVVWGKGR